MDLVRVEKRHSKQVTSLAVALVEPFVLYSSSRDGTVLSWALRDGREKLTSAKELTRHSHFVQEVAVSPDGKHVASVAWDNTIHICSNDGGIKQIVTESHPLSVCFTSDSAFIGTGHRNGDVKFWDLAGDCKLSVVHPEKALWGEIKPRWVTQLKCTPAPSTATFATGGWDGRVVVWRNVEPDLRSPAPLSSSSGSRSDRRQPRRHPPSAEEVSGRLQAAVMWSPTEAGFINSVIVSPDGSLVASAGKAGDITLYDYLECRHLYTLRCSHLVHNMVYSTTRYWLCAALSNDTIKIWDLETKKAVIILEYLKSPGITSRATCLQWTALGDTLFTGHADGSIAEWYLPPDRDLPSVCDDEEVQWLEPAVAEWAVEANADEWAQAGTVAEWTNDQQPSWDV